MIKWDEAPPLLKSKGLNGEQRRMGAEVVQRESSHPQKRATHTLTAEERVQ